MQNHNPSNRRKARKECVVLFSGGRDSSLTCVLLARENFYVHPLTFDNGAYKGIQGVTLRHKEIKKLYPKYIKKSEIIPSNGYFKDVVLKPLAKDFQKYFLS